MNKNLILILLTTFFAFSSNAQLFQAQTKDALRLKNRSLIVLINDENPAILKRYRKKPERQEQIKAMIAKSNKAFYDAFTNYWNASKDLIFLQEKDLSTLPTGDYALFRFIPDEDAYGMDLSQSPFELKNELMKFRKYGKMEFYLMEDKNKDPFLTFFTPTIYPFEEDVISSVAQINNFLLQKYNDPSFSMKDYEKLVEDWNIKIKDKTLLVDTATIEKIQGNYNYIKEEYPFPYELTSGEKIAEKIKTKDSNYVYVVVFPHYDQLNRGGSYEGTYGGGMDNFNYQLYFTHLVLETDTFFILGIAKNLDNFVNRRSWKQYYKFLETDSFNFEDLTK